MGMNAYFALVSLQEMMCAITCQVLNVILLNGVQKYNSSQQTLVFGMIGEFFNYF